MTSFKKKRCLWFNSAFTDDFTLAEGKIIDMTFNIPPFQIYNHNNLKVISYIRDDANTKPIVIKMKEPYLTNRSVVNTDKEAYPIIYSNHTGHEGMTSMSPKFTLTPQQIPRFVFKADENFTPIYSASSGVAIYQIFTYTGTIQTFTVPTGVNSVNVYCWGAGGGGSLALWNSANGGYAGNGGFLSATLTIPNGTTSLKVIVGQGGKKGVANNISGTAYGGGGNGSGGNGDWALGGGGGLSGVFVDDANMTVSSGIVNSSATAIIIAAGGGGAGAPWVDNATLETTLGGNGGGLTGNNASSTGGSGTGATPTTAGSGGISGGKYFGGSRADNWGGGGGSGWFGGGSGFIKADTSPYGIGGGGGGSSYLNTGSYTFTNQNFPSTQANGTRTAPGNTNSYYQSGVALGSEQGLFDGGNGLVVIEYLEKRNDGLTPNETLIQSTTTMTITKNSKYSINYQTPIKIPNGSYTATFSGGNINFNGINDKSYPLLKDGSGITINPFVWYKFDDSTNLGLDSMGNHNLNNNNNVEYNPNDIAKGIGSSSFNGTYKTLLKSDAFNLNNQDFTICVWIKRTENSRVDKFFTIGTVYNTRQALVLSYEANNIINFAFWADDLITPAYPTEAGNWVHLAFAYQATTRIKKVYRNGVEIASGTSFGQLSTNNYVEIGRYDIYYLKALLDDFRIYKNYLSLSQIQELYNGRLAIYNPPSFELGVELEDTNLTRDNIASIYR